MIDTAQLNRLIAQSEFECLLTDDDLMPLARAIYHAGQEDSAAELDRLRGLANSAEMNI